MTDVPARTLMSQALQAQRRGQFEDALALLRRAADLDDALALDARLQLARLLIQRGRPDEAAPLLEAAQARAEAEGLPHKAATAVHLQALLYRRRDPARALRLLEEHVPAPTAAAPVAPLAQWFHYRGLLEVDRNDLAEGERFLFRAHDYYREIPDEAGLSEVYDSLANLLLKTGRVGPALEFARRSLRLKEKLGDLFGQAISHGTIGRCHFLQAHYDEAAAAFRRDLDLARQVHDPDGVGIALNSLGEVELLRRDAEAALACFRDNLGRADGGEVNAAHALLGLARVHLAAGRTDEAAAAADQMQARLADRPDLARLHAALAGLRGAIAGRRGEYAAGERLLNQAITDLLRFGAQLETLSFLYALRDLYQASGDTARAVRVMSRALDLLSAVGADEEVGDVEDWLRTVDSPALTRLALERHFPSHLVESILAGRLTRRETQRFTRRQTVTVLFSDLRNYTTLSEGLTPEAVLELLNDWFTEATRAIQRHGGVVDKFIGDAVMALFGVPEPRPEAAADAVRAALALRDTLRARNLRHRALGGREIQIGVGLHTGEAVVGFLGSHLRLSYTAIGDAVNVASRLEGATKGFACDVLISQATEEAQRPYGVAETVLRGEAELKGHTPMAVYQVLGPRRVR